MEDPTMWPDWISAIVAVLALALAAWSWLGSRRSASKAEDAATRSASAAERSAAALERQADRFTPKWSVERAYARVHLRNESGEDAFDVIMTLDDPWYFADEADAVQTGRTSANCVARHPHVGAHSAVGHFVTTDGTDIAAALVITWKRVNGETAVWSIPTLALIRD